MIFKPDLLTLVLAGKKTQTRRPVKDGVPCRYLPGRTYAAQPGRGKAGVARIRVLHVSLETVGMISFRDAQAEGFKSIYRFYERWEEMHGPSKGWCWRIQFELVKSPT